MVEFVGKIRKVLFRFWRGLTIRTVKVEPQTADAPTVPVPTAELAKAPVSGLSPKRSARSAVLAARLAGVSRRNGRTVPPRKKPIGKARANLKPKPVMPTQHVAGAKGSKVGKRSPDLFATKVAARVAKKPTTRIYIEKRVKPSAQIIAFPVRKPRLAAPRLKRVA